MFNNIPVAEKKLYWIEGTTRRWGRLYLRPAAASPGSRMVWTIHDMPGRAQRPPRPSVERQARPASTQRSRRGTLFVDGMGRAQSSADDCAPSITSAATRSGSPHMAARSTSGATTCLNELAPTGSGRRSTDAPDRPNQRRFPRNFRASLWRILQNAFSPSASPPTKPGGPSVETRQEELSL